MADDTLTFVNPRYEQACITDLLPSVCDGLGLPGAYDILGLGPADKVAILVVDGLGLHQLARNRTTAPFLADAVHQELTSVFPSTTPAGLTSLGTGLPPGGHGLVGASFRLNHENRVLHPLSWGQDPDPRSVQGEPTWWQRAEIRNVAVSIVGPRAYAGTGLTESALGGAPYRGADGPGERIAEMADALRGPGPRLVYGYWEWLDRTAHVRGVGSTAYEAELRAVNTFLEQFVAAAPPDVRILVTADHGVVDCPETVDLDANSDLMRDVRLVAGEPRMRHLYVAPGTQSEVAERYRQALGDRAQILTRAEAVSAGLFGPMAAEHEVRVGDVIALATGRVRLTSPSRDRIVSSLIGQHGSLTAEEMMVPLLKWETS